MERLYSLLDAYSQANDVDRPSLEAKIWPVLGSERTVLTLDMVRFSMTVREHGIVYYMARVRKMQRYTRPVVAKHRGQVVKFEADNLLAAFERPSDGV
jgi:class 3 adenylate cyclase